MLCAAAHESWIPSPQPAGPLSPIRFILQKHSMLTCEHQRVREAWDRKQKLLNEATERVLGAQGQDEEAVKAYRRALAKSDVLRTVSL
jgi:hypothetical protein